MEINSKKVTPIYFITRHVTDGQTDTRRPRIPHKHSFVIKAVLVQLFFSLIQSWRQTKVFTYGDDGEVTLIAILTKFFNHYKF